MSGYTIVNLNSDSAAWAKSVKDALTKTNSAEVRDAWIDVGINSAKITAGVAELAANDPAWAKWVGNTATLASIGLAAWRISQDLQSSNGYENVKAGDALAMVGGISDSIAIWRLMAQAAVMPFRTASVGVRPISCFDQV